MLSVTRSIDPNLVLSSVASVLMVDIVALFLSIITQKKYKVLVIEEQEEAMEPIRQVLFAMFIDEAVAEFKNIMSTNTYIILSTHSPYIIGGFASPDIYYFYYDVKDRKFISARGLRQNHSCIRESSTNVS